MMADRWSAFRAYAARALGKPTFDSEEREPKLRIAAQLRDALATTESAARVAAIRECISATGYPSADLTTREQNEWLEAWISTGDQQLEWALDASSRTRADELARLAGFARAADAAAVVGTLSPNPAATLAFASLFNFALEPQRLPFVLAKPFQRVEEFLGDDSPAAGTVLEAYRRHFGFAQEVEARLRAEGVPVRDMLDVQSLIVDASRNASFWVEPEGPPPPARPADVYLSICAIYRDEAPYLREWLEFHRLVGAERFYLYDNGSVDEHLEILNPYVADGIVRLHDWPMAQGQLPAYEHCIAEYGHESRWIAFIDLDEFLFSPTGRPLPEVLPEYEQWPAVGVNWAVFGPSGHVEMPPGLVTESYLERLNVAANKTIKSIVDPARVRHCAGVHRFEYDRLGTVDENHYPIFGGQTKSVSYQRLRINHYFTKSVEEFRRQSDRRRPDPAMVERRFDQEVLSRWEEGAERDEVITQYLPALREALSAPAQRRR